MKGRAVVAMIDRISVSSILTRRSFPREAQAIFNESEGMAMMLKD